MKHVYYFVAVFKMCRAIGTRYLLAHFEAHSFRCESPQINNDPDLMTTDLRVVNPMMCEIFLLEYFRGSSKLNQRLDVFFAEIFVNHLISHRATAGK